MNSEPSSREVAKMYSSVTSRFLRLGLRDPEKVQKGMYDKYMENRKVLRELHLEVGDPKYDNGTKIDMMRKMDRILDDIENWYLF